MPNLPFQGRRKGFKLMGAHFCTPFLASWAVQDGHNNGYQGAIC